ncbi:MAG TPA: AAA family ATPase [Syntrophomonadaceae bacterium]|nr:AAA family ATPase [Syntrophomonadaceae bacterium]
MAIAERELRPAPNMAAWSQEQKVLYALIRHEGTKVQVVADAVGKSHSAICQYIGGTYSSPRALDPTIREYLTGIGRWQDEEENYLDAGQSQEEYIQPGWVVTRDAARVLGVCRRCWEKKEMGMITGDPGTGKTYTFAQLPTIPNLPHVVIPCDETTSKKSLLVDICDVIGLPTRGASPTLLRRIVKYLRSDPALLIFDEADLLRGTDVYEVIRAIYDKSGKVGVVLCGNNNLAERILVFAEGRPELARLRDRIGYYQRLTGLSMEEAEQFVAGLNATKGARQLLVNIGTSRGIRQLTKAVSRLVDATGGDRINEDLVEQLGSIVLSFNA